MKKIVIALSMLLTVQLAGAQTKASINAVNDVNKAIEAVENPKKAAKPATWIKLAESYVAAFEAPYSSLWTGMSMTEIQLLMSGEQLLSQEQAVIEGQSYNVLVFADKKLYVDGAGILQIIEITQPAYSDIDPLSKAIEAYMKAAELDEKGKMLGKINEGLAKVASKYFDKAMSAYSMGNPQEASDIFVASLAASENKVANRVDTLAIYNAAFTASQAGDTTRAISMLERCVEIGHFENGDVNARLGELYIAKGEGAKGKAILEDGFKKFPQSQSILIGLINYYMNSGEDANRLFVLIDEAKKNEPNNASLYYVEGDIYKQLGEREKALECYYKSYDIDNNYLYGLYAAGAYWYDEAVRVSDAAQNEMDDKKYMAMVEEFEGYMLEAVAPFEKLFSVAGDNQEFKQAAAEYLKSIYFRFRARDTKYLEGYEKYNAYLETL